MRMGARIEGIGTDRLTIEGVDQPAPAPTHRIIPDRIEAGTYHHAPPRSPAARSGWKAPGWTTSGATARILREAGVEVTERPDGPARLAR